MLNLTVVKRSGQRVNFDGTKIALAIKKAFDSVNKKYKPNEVNKIYEEVLNHIRINYKERKTINVEDIQDIIEIKLKKYKSEVYKSFNKYRLKRATSREVFEAKQQHKFVKGIEKLTINAQNNSTLNPVESINKFGIIFSKQFAEAYLIDSKSARMHSDGHIYLNNLEYYTLGSPKSLIADLSSISTINNIKQLALNLKNEIHKEITLSNLNKNIESYTIQKARKIYIKILKNNLSLFGFIEYIDIKEIENSVNQKNSIDFKKIYKAKSSQIQNIFDQTNISTLKILKENIKNELKELFDILENNENNFKTQYAISIINDNTYTLNFINDIIFDLFKHYKKTKLIIKLINKNINEKIINLVKNNKNISFINTKQECLDYLPSGSMAFENYNNKNTSIGRMVITDISINLPRIAQTSKNKNNFLKELDKRLEQIKNQLKDSFEFIGLKYKENYQTIFKYKVLIDSEKLQNGQKVRKVFKNGTLNIDLYGLSNASKILSKNSENLSFEILKHIKTVLSKYIKEERLMFTYKEANNKQIADYFLNIDKSIYGSKIKDNKYITFESTLKKQISKEKYQSLITGGNQFTYYTTKNNIENTINTIIKTKIKYFQIKVGAEK